MEEETTLVFNIEKFSLQDGPGIRTVVFLKGCPLHCLWCHNPESRSFRQELLFAEEQCTFCGFCRSICEKNCHSIEGMSHILERENCILCGKCVEKCYPEALALCGKSMTVNEVMEEVLKDKDFYGHSGGGLTISGGEPLSHPEFTLALLKEAKKNAIHTALETSGFGGGAVLEKIHPFVDLWLWDVKCLPKDYPELTGGNWEKIEENFRYISACGGEIHLRCPLIPAVNDSPENLDFIGEIAETTRGVKEIHLEAYHSLGTQKSLQLGEKDPFTAPLWEREELEGKAQYLREKTHIPIVVFTA